MKQDVFKGVLWDHGTVTGPDGKTYHKTVVVGVVLTEEPLENSTTGSHEFVLGQSGGMLAEGLGSLKPYKSRVAIGDASSVLTGMDYIQPAESDSCWEEE